jgi:Tol biopolymer transport system component
VWAVPTLGGEPRLYLEGVAELDWSSDGTRIVYHTPGPGDPMFVNDQTRRAERKIFTAPPGLHSHFPVWSPDDAFIYFVYGSVPNNMDIWRMDPAGGARERMTSHDSRVSHPTFLNRRTLLYLATDGDGAGPWLYALDVERRKTRRISFGVERYTSLAASADGRRLVVTVANPKRTLWRVPITDPVTEESGASRVPVPTSGARAPRLGPGYLLYVSSRNDAESIWKVADGIATELWSMAGARVIAGPAIAPDGRIAFSAEEGGRTRMYVMNADGSSARMLPESLEPRGAPAWSPDGQSIAVAATIHGAPCLIKVSVGRQTFVPLVSEFAADPAWSPDGASIVYSGPDVGTTFQVRLVSADGRVKSEPNIRLSRGARRLAFLPGQRALVVLRGEINHKNFWVIDPESGRERRLTNFGPNFVIGDFDVSPDGVEIVFDREQDNSDIVLIER